MRRTVSVLAGLCVLAATRTASFGDVPAALLKRPVSPAAIGLLAPYAQDPRVAERWKAALRDSSADVRGVAARAIHTGALRTLLPDLDAALATEKDADAAREEIRGIVDLGDAERDGAVLAAAGRFEGALDGDVLRAFARARGLAALPLYFSKLRNLLLTRKDQRAFFRIASRAGEQTLTGAAAMALGRRDAAVWALILELSSGDRALASSPILRSALASPEPSIRAEAAWYLAEKYAESPPSREEAAAAVASLRAGQAADLRPVSGVEVVLGPELLLRAAGEKPTESAATTAALAQRGSGHLDSRFERSHLGVLLTAGERASLAKRPPETDPPVDTEPISCA
jgi:hypothetical protein